MLEIETQNDKYEGVKILFRKEIYVKSHFEGDCFA